MTKPGIGIDFGTSNSAAAIFDGESVTLVQLETDDAIIPSATYIDRALTAKTGQHAVDQYIADNTGRTVEMVPEVIGETSQFVEGSGDDGGPGEVDTATEKIYGAAVTDSSLQGRLFRGTKRLLGDESVRRLMVFDHPFRLVALITPLLLRIRQRVEAEVGAIGSANLGYPVNFEGRDQFSNQLAMSRLGEAFGYAGVKAQYFYPEPIAAAVSFLHTNADAQGETLLCLDFGGGTLDFCVLRCEAENFSVIATHGIGLGGDHLDQILFRELLFPELGKGEIWRRRGFDREIETRFPFEDFEELLVIFARIKTLKAQLSQHHQATLDVPEIDLQVDLSRHQFEGLIAEPLQRVAQAVDETVAKAGMRHSDIDIVLGTGGSSLIPAVKGLLEDRFAGRVVEHDPFTSVATGLAIANFRGLTFPH